MSSQSSGKSWRILAWEEGVPLELQNRGTIDEVVVEEWLHLEQMDEHLWWLRVGDARIMAERDADGVMQVSIERNFYAS